MRVTYSTIDDARVRKIEVRAPRPQFLDISHFSVAKFVLFSACPTWPATGTYSTNTSTNPLFQPVCLYQGEKLFLEKQVRARHCFTPSTFGSRSASTSFTFTAPLTEYTYFTFLHLSFCLAQDAVVLSVSGPGQSGLPEEHYGTNIFSLQRPVNRASAWVCHTNPHD